LDARRAIAQGTRLAPEIGSKSMVSRVLSGKRKLTLEHAKKLATRFGISPALFID
ncbi:helix-turn-helix domain-containing protein, partial [Escherichia sp. SS-MK2]